MEAGDQLNNKFIQIKKWIENNSKKILWFFIIFYILIFSFFSLYKYLTFRYIGLDLAIFNQTFYNTGQGNFFGLTIHPHSYLGDHFAPIIIFLIPFYFIFKNPISLLLLQTIILALSAYPLYLIARKKLNPCLSLFISSLYLLNVFVHNINSYEFHILPLAIFLLLFTFYFYLKEKFGLFMLFLVLSLLVREDVPLVILMFSFLALIEKKSLKWILTPLILGASWFVLAMKMTGYFSGYGQYKFIRYYGWLGNDIKSILLAIINNPFIILKHLFSGQNIVFLIGLMLPFGFLSLFKTKYLLPASFIILQILLLGGTGALALEIHYTSLIIPFLFISLIFVFEQIFYQEKKNRLLKVFQREKNIFLIILLLITLYSSLVVGPSFSFAKDVFNYSEIKEEIKLRNDFTKLIPADIPVATGFHFLPKLSSREKIYSLHYQYLGKKQYSDLDYEIPEEVQYLLFDLNDFLYYQFLYQEYDEKNIKGAERLRQLITERNFVLTQYIGKFLLYEKDKPSKITPLNSVIKELPNEASKLEVDFKNKIRLLGYKEYSLKEEKLNNNSYKILPLTLYWQGLKETEFDYQIEIKLIKDNKLAFEENHPLAAFYPTHDWKEGEIVSSYYKFLIPQNLTKGEYQLRVSLYHPEGKMGLNKSKVFRPFVTKLEDLGEINLLWINL